MIFLYRVLCECVRDRWKKQITGDGLQSLETIPSDLNSLLLNHTLFFLIEPFCMSLHDIN